MTACLVIAVGDIEMPEYSEGLRVRMTPRWREMDSNFRYRGAKAADFRSIPGYRRGS
jgi:hypothetical protein